MDMRKSRVLRKLRAGNIVSCIKINLTCPRATEIAALCDFDCVWLDTEHVPNEWFTIENQIRSAKIYDVDSMVRVARGSYSDYIRPFEADAAGIMVPHLMGLDDAKKVVWQTRFGPVGRRAVDGGNADAAYCMVDFNQYLKTANEQRFVVVQIEDPEPLDQLDQIAALPGLDMLFFGPGDFSHGAGIPGQWDHPLISQTCKRIAQAARANNKFAGTVGSPDSLPRLLDMGYSFISIGADVVGLSDYFKRLLEAFSKFC